MNVIGIICEYNPFHNGHLYHLNKIKEMYCDSIIIVIMPGYFTQRGEFSILTKENKVNIALNMGIDLVIELPFVFASQSADIFAYGAIKILNSLNVDKIIFGSECDDIVLLKDIANYQNTKEYQRKVKQYIAEGINYPTALSKALNHEIKSPNDLLAISYIKAINKINTNIKPITIKRTNDYHSINTDNEIISATAIRHLINEKQDITPYIPNNLKYEFVNIDNEKIFNLLKYKIISDREFLNKFCTVDEGIENRIIKYINECLTLDELILKIKTKRYTFNKIKRMFIHILCSFTKEESINFRDPEYIRILGFNNNGRNYLNSIKKNTDLPIISKLSSSKSKMLQLEQRATNIYSLITNINLNEKEYQIFPIRK